MTSSLKDVEKKALELSSHDRAVLIHQLLQSLDKENEEENVDESWSEELKRRYDLYKKGKISEEPADKVFQDAKANLK
jgi:putative addiction module component (TIGR02574 family)